MPACCPSPPAARGARSHSPAPRRRSPRPPLRVGRRPPPSPRPSPSPRPMTPCRRRRQRWHQRQRRAPTDRAQGPQGVPAVKAADPGTRGRVVGGVLGGTAAGAPAAAAPAPAKQRSAAAEYEAASRGDLAKESKAKTENRRSRHAPAAPPPPPVALMVEGGKGHKKDAPAPEPIRSTDSFQRHEPNPWVQTAEDRLSTFAVDVDTASYTVARRMIENDGLPHPASVRVEEFVNYFKYEYPQPERGAFSVNLEGAPSPFGKGKTILKVGLQGRAGREVAAQAGAPGLPRRHQRVHELAGQAADGAGGPQAAGEEPQRERHRRARHLRRQHP